MLHTEEDFTGEDLEKFKLCEKMAAKGKIRVKEDGMWFNLADICVVVGGIAAAAYYLLLADKLEHKEAPHGTADADR